MGPKNPEGVGPAGRGEPKIGIVEDRELELGQSGRHLVRPRPADLQSPGQADDGDRLGGQLAVDQLLERVLHQHPARQATEPSQLRDDASAGPEQGREPGDGEAEPEESGSGIVADCMMPKRNISYG